MSSGCRTFALLLVLTVVSGFAGTAAVPLRVCADPNNLPFSNQRREGFENRIAAIVARELHRPLTYFWLPQRRGFVRNTLTANQCDVVIGVPAESGMLRPTRPYYRSTYVFVSRQDRALHLRSFDDPRLKTLTIGIQVTGDDYANPPAAQALAARQIVENVRGYTVYGDYSQPDPPRRLIDAVASQKVDVAVAWGPLAGYFARREPVAMEVTPVSPQADSRFVRFVYDIAMGVRRDDTALARRLDDVIARRHDEIRRVLIEYGVPLVEKTS
jgi:quinoprotein dehydrogenase-associated probable ABC transporter substrate-binding protein